MSKKRKKKAEGEKRTAEQKEAGKKEEKEKQERILQKKQKKREKLFQNLHEIKPEQEGLVRFVDVRWEVFEEIEGKWVHTGRKHTQGLQVENFVYTIDGQYKMINRKSFRITKEYEGIPDWATKDLIKRYNLFSSCLSRPMETIPSQSNKSTSIKKQRR